MVIGQYHNWYIRENEISISLMNYHVRIIPNFNDNILYFKLVITNNEMKKKSYLFDTLEIKPD